jgi:hypothetical protein
MNKIIYWILLTVLISAFSFHDTCLAWNDEKTHITITKKAVEHSVLSPAINDRLKKIGIVSDFEKEILIWPNKVCDEKRHKTECKVADWIAYGAEKEDAAVDTWGPNYSGRYNNHFHDPISGQGLNDMTSGRSALEWAQDSDAQSDYPEGDQSWSTLRMLYYIALMETDQAVRSETLAQLFKGIGHQMHLVQDMAVPAHEHNGHRRCFRQQAVP